MTSNHARDDWADGRTDEALRRGLDALAGAGAQASALDAALGDVRRRVRRRRTVKQAGIGASTLGVAAALVLGGAALLPDAPQPLPGPATSPTTTPSPSGSPSDEARPDDARADDAAVGLVEDGYRPSWLEGVNLTCGMPADDLSANADGQRLDLLGVPTLDDDTSADGTETVQTWRVPTRLDGVGAADAGHRVSLPTLLWTQGGRVVDVGVNVTEAGMDQVGDAPAERTAEDSSLMSCAPVHADDGSAPDTYETELPAGEYQVRAFVQLWDPGFTAAELVVSAPVAVEVDATGEGGARNAASGSGKSGGSGGSGDAGCSAAGLDLPDPDLADLAEPARTTVAAMFTAALACDDETLIALAEAADRVDENWGGQSPRELLELPAAEQDEDVYAILARLLSATQPCNGEVHGLGGALHLYSWPRMAPPCQAAAPDWQDAVDAGALTAQESADWQAADGGPEYEGWRLTVDSEGRWAQFVDGYLGPPRD
ncbi:MULTISPECIES: hypothetical protein [unclassified Isoptericola]|uniref:hypothetical protein n=1 Tax=unclassified Isoptericola TaxID=2623355 RepID=UPI0036559787